MAIRFARLEYKSRKKGDNACRSAAYDAREAIMCERTGELFYFKNRDHDHIYHAVLLPEGVDEKFKDISLLWNLAEAAEKRKDSQVAKELVVALPDNPEVSLAIKIEIANRIAQEVFVRKGLAVQIDIHAPHTGERNWHAHILAFTRRFKENGLELEDKKDRGLDPQVRKGRVTEAEYNFGKLSARIQNEVFEEYGLDIRVDLIGPYAQKHLGPERMRGLLKNAEQQAKLIQGDKNKKLKTADEVLFHIGKTQAVLSKSEIERYLKKHTDNTDGLKEAVWNHSDLLKLSTKEGADTGLYTTRQTREFEEKAMRMAGYIQKHAARALSFSILQEKIKADPKLTNEQIAAFRHATSNEMLTLIEGRAGVGKGRTMQPIRDAHIEAGYQVIGLAPTHAVAKNLEGDGFDAMTIKEFLFQHHRDSLQVQKGKTLLMVDEAAMVDTDTYNELFQAAWHLSCKVVLVGDYRQLPSVERGGLFEVLAKEFKSKKITQVQRQKDDFQKEVSYSLSEGRAAEAVDLLSKNGKLIWSSTKAEAITHLIHDALGQAGGKLILARRNIDVDAINMAIHKIKKEQGDLTGPEFMFKTPRGDMPFAVGSRIQIVQTNKSLNLKNGTFGTISELSKDRCTFITDANEEMSFNPNHFNGLRHGYAGTIYKAQGATIDHVFVLHDKNGRSKENYVALSRHKQDLKVYLAIEDTPNESVLIEQLSKRDDRGSSLVYIVASPKEKAITYPAWVERARQQAAPFIQKAKDYLKTNHSYYDLSHLKNANVAKGIKEIIEFEIRQAEKKEGLYTGKPLNESYANRNAYKKEPAPFYNVDKIKQGTIDRLEDVVRHFLGQPNQNLSSQEALRFGKKGSTVVQLSGNKRGLWHDFETGKGGHILGLIQAQKSLSFKETLKEVSSFLGGDYTEHMPSQKAYKVEANIPIEDSDKLKKVHSLYARSRAIQNTIGEKYLRAHRGIIGDLPQDVRFIQGHDPALVAFTRNKKGEIQSAQMVFLDAQTGEKSKTVPVVKRSIGPIKGSFVEIQAGDNNRVFIAEGLETALSLKAAGLNGRIVASLGINNMAHYNGPEKQVIIAGDHDDPHSKSAEQLHCIHNKLIERGYDAHIILPETRGADFNDVLLQKGIEGVRDQFCDIQPPIVSMDQKVRFLQAFYHKDLESLNVKDLEKWSERMSLLSILSPETSKTELLMRIQYEVQRYETLSHYDDKARAERLVAIEGHIKQQHPTDSLNDIARKARAIVRQNDELLQKHPEQQMDILFKERYNRSPSADEITALKDIQTQSVDQLAAIRMIDGKLSDTLNDDKIHSINADSQKMIEEREEKRMQYEKDRSRGMEMD